jgi:hypothetical protein
VAVVAECIILVLVALEVLEVAVLEEIHQETVFLELLTQAVAQVVVAIIMD